MIVVYCRLSLATTSAARAASMAASLLCDLCFEDSELALRGLRLGSILHELRLELRVGGFKPFPCLGGGGTGLKEALLSSKIAPIPVHARQWSMRQLHARPRYWRVATRAVPAAHHAAPWRSECSLPPVRTAAR